MLGLALAVLLGGVAMQLRCAALHSDRYDQLLLYASQNDAAGRSGSAVAMFPSVLQAASAKKLNSGTAAIGTCARALIT